MRTTSCDLTSIHSLCEPGRLCVRRTFTMLTQVTSKDLSCNNQHGYPPLFGLLSQQVSVQPCVTLRCLARCFTQQQDRRPGGLRLRMPAVDKANPAGGQQLFETPSQCSTGIATAHSARFCLKCSTEIDPVIEGSCGSLQGLAACPIPP